MMKTGNVLLFDSRALRATLTIDTSAAPPVRTTCICVKIYIDVSLKPSTSQCYLDHPVHCSCGCYTCLSFDGSLGCQYYRFFCCYRGYLGYRAYFDQQVYQHSFLAVVTPTCQKYFVRRTFRSLL